MNQSGIRKISNADLKKGKKKRDACSLSTAEKTAALSRRLERSPIPPFGHPLPQAVYSHCEARSAVAIQFVPSGAKAPLFATCPAARGHFHTRAETGPAGSDICRVRGHHDPLA
jgi:hypothetical protein